MAKTSLPKIFSIDNLVFAPKPSGQHFHDLEGMVFGKWRVLGFYGQTAGSSYWTCQCECGHIRAVFGGNLVAGKSKGCGHCSAKLNAVKHGMCNSPEYTAFINAQTRCNNPRIRHYARYGGRGIKFLFQSFEEFYEHLGQRPSPAHSVDRIDNDGHYEPGNVRWATPSEQGNNTRSNRFITYNGITKTMSEWAALLGILMPTIHARLARGFCDSCALSCAKKAFCVHKH